MKRRFVVVAGVALVAIVAGSVPRAQVVEQILVKVNGEVFSKSDLETKQLQTLRQRGTPPVDLRSAAGDQQLRKTLDEIMPQLMVDAINEMVVIQRGKELGYSLSDDQYKNAVDGIRKENKLDTTEKFLAALKSEGLTETDLRRILERQMLFERVRQVEVFGRIGVTEEEARKYYDAHPDEFTTPAAVTLREILIAVPTDGRGVNVAVDDAAKAKADQVRGRLLAGETFERLVAEVSDAPSRATDGLVGPFNLPDLGESLRRILEPLKAGEMTSVLRTTAGYQIFKVETSAATEVLTFEQARGRISERVFTDKRKEEFDKYLAKLRSQAIIEWKNQDVKKAFDEGLKQLPVENRQSAVR